MAEELYSFEAIDGVRMPWNLWPRSKVEALKCVLPFSILYSPVKATQGLEVLNYPPVLCKSCTATVSAYAVVDYSSKMWVCPHCATRNFFPAAYADLTPDRPFPELARSSVEYIVPQSLQYPPVFIFIVDTAVSEDELEACKSTLKQALEMMPENCLVGLISFGTHVHVHELQANGSGIAKLYVFRGTGSFSPNTVALQLGFKAAARLKGGAGDGFLADKFLVSLEDAFAIEMALDGLQPDAYMPASDHRKSRCTGTAVQVAAGLAATGLPGGVCPVRLMLFVGGPCTEGKAAMVGKELSTEIRSHKDLEKDAAPYWRPAVQFYEEVTQAMVQHAHTLDIFACALEQSGLAEMKPAVQATGGVAVQTDTFRNPVFKDSLTRVFAPPEDEGFFGRCACATMDVFVSRDIRIQGMLGCGASLRKDGAAVSNSVIGQGRSCQWRFPSLDATSTACVVFEITADKSAAAADKGKSDEALYIQFSTKYLHWDGSWRQRVTTLSRRWVSGKHVHELLHGFDQEAAAVVAARVCTWKMETEEDFDATRWIDRSLIRLCSRFGTYAKDDSNSFSLAPEMNLYPGFMFHLRRSQFVQVFGNSPDETAFARLMLNKEMVGHAVNMIQPLLYRYVIGEEPGPAILDVSSISPDAILFLDTYFYLVVFHGANIARWRQEGYHTQPGYEEFAALLRAPQEEAAAIVRRRFPVPRVVDADNHTVAGRSQQRFLLVKLNPSSTHASTAGPGEVILTDDVSLEVFLNHLKALAVQS